MTADSEKSTGSSASLCLVCNASIVSNRNACPILYTNVTASEQPVANILTVVLGQDIRKNHSDLICKKCFKLCNEVDELQERLSEIKMELSNYYQKTIRKLEGSHLEEEDDSSDHVIVLPKKSIQSACQGIQKTADSSKSSSGRRPVGRPRKYSVQSSFEVQNNEKVVSMVEDSEEKINPKEEPINEADEEEIMEEEDNEGAVEIRTDDGMQEDLEDSVIIKTEITSDEETEVVSEESMVQDKSSKSSSTLEIPAVIPQMIVGREDKVYTCLLCPADNKVTGDDKEIVAHMKNMHSIKLYICDVCGSEFLKRTELQSHYEKHMSNEEGEYVCDVCNRYFNNLRLFRVHKRMHLPQAKNYFCESCGKGFLSRNTLEEHMNVHTGNRPYRCNACQKEFASKYTLKAHEKTHVDRPRPFKCIQCGKTFITDSNLQQHLRTHNSVRNHTCKVCGKAFSSARNLEVHCIIHSGFKPFNCRICGKAFARKAEIRDHERTHTGEKPYQCEFCGATFGQRSNLQSHKRATHYDDKRYQCIECNKAFKRRRLLDYHIKAVHTGERPYKCQVCSATFIYPEHFKKHRRIHTGEKPYQCEVCGKAFNSRDNRNAHRFVHSDKKPYECLVCGLGFMRKPQLYNHMQTQGHVNDTIVVNQPRLTTDDDQLVEEPSTDLITIHEVDEEKIEQDQVLITDKDGNMVEQFEEQEVSQVIIQKDGEAQFASGEVGLIIDGQVQYQEGAQSSLEAALVEAGIEEGTTLVVPEDVAQSGQTTVVQTPGGPVRLVQLNFPGDDQPTWFNIVEQ